MSPRIAVAYYKLKLFSSTDLVDISMLWMMDGVETKDITILASEISPIMSNVAPLFESIISEMDIKIPENQEAIDLVLMSYLENIVLDVISPYEGMQKIDNNLYSTGDNENFVGSSMGIEHMYTWYRELQDAYSHGVLFYYTDLPREEAIIKFNEHLKGEAKNKLEKLQIKYPNLNGKFFNI